ncbi:alpha/beta fold hydrolase [Kutzneria kofuensis]|uniref:Pimeloyl-ACP methyl ester carboxylesterase n=1 Tax=Kutzneria kofuensis TaxID=103725 RepID=A0A7W9KRR3_9PSEU|nr:alpha/beta hydrolase [Kutzneria kofuensis]MBB5897538.1 pimeloyl-ACP methyl ester carboxylesterase [Kutzneria kofuensis]
MTATIYKTEAGGHRIRRQYEEWLAHWPVPADRRTLPTRHGDTFVMVSGTETGPPVLLLHGSGGNTLTWMSTVGRLADRFRLYAVDVIGEPGLSAPSRPPLGSPAYGEWLDDVLAGLGLTEVQVVATSLGAWFAIDYATRRPGRISRMVLTVPGGIGRQRFGKMAAFFLGRLLGRKQPEPTSPGEKYVRMVFQHFRPRLIMPLFPTARLRLLTMPLLVIVGDQDELLDSRATRRRLAAAAPHATVVTLSGAGHMLPDQAERIGGFLHD